MFKTRNVQKQQAASVYELSDRHSLTYMRCQPRHSPLPVLSMW